MKQLLYLLLFLPVFAGAQFGKKISELPSVTSLNSADLVPVVQSGKNYKATVGNFANASVPDTVTGAHRFTGNVGIDSLTITGTPTIPRPVSVSKDSLTGLVGRGCATDCYWLLNGNGNTQAGTNFIGTTDSKDLYFKTKNTTAIVIDTNQNVGIGNTTPNAKLDVTGSFHAVQGSGDTTVLTIGKTINLNNFGIQVPIDGIYTKKLRSLTSIIGLIDWTVYGATEKALGLGLIRTNRFQGLNVEYDNLTLSRYDTVTGRYQYGFTAYSGSGHADMFVFDAVRAFDMSSVVCDSSNVILRQYYSHNQRASMMVTVADSGITLGKGLGADEKISTVALHVDTNANVGIGTSTPTASLHVAGQVRIVDGTQAAGMLLTSDANGNATWGNQILTDTATLDFGTIAPNGHETLTITVVGAALSDVVSLGIPNSSVNDHGAFMAWVSATDTVSVKCFNFDGSGFDPAAGVFKVKVFK